jgi:hypothetical protein
VQNPIALQFSYTVTQTSFHQTDPANTATVSASEAELNAVRALPVVKRTRTDGIIYNDGTHRTTITDLTTAADQPTFTDMPMDAANLRTMKTAIVDHRRDTATVTIFDAGGTVLFTANMPKQSYKTLVDSLRAQPNPCPVTVQSLAAPVAGASGVHTQGISAPIAGAAAPGPPTPTGSMRQLLLHAQIRGATIRQLGTNGRYSISFAHSDSALGIRFNTQAARTQVYINANPAVNVVESVHSFDAANTLLHSTYYVPRATGQCSAEYKTILHVSYYKTPSNVAMQFVTQTDIEQITLNNYIR